MITVVDYGMGNLRSVRRALQGLGADVLITADQAQVRDAATLILPGVGAFGEAVRRIDALGLRAPILDHVQRRRPLLGICLGMQLLFAESEESPGVRGLSLLPGSVVKFRGVFPCPISGGTTRRPCARLRSSVRRADATTSCIRSTSSTALPLLRRQPMAFRLPRRCNQNMCWGSNSIRRSHSMTGWLC